MKKILLIVVTTVIAIAVLGLLYFYFYPREAQNILVPEVDQIKTASIRLKGDTAYVTLNIRFKNKGIFKLNIDSLGYSIHFDTLHALQRSGALDLVLAPGEIDSMAIPLAIPYKRIVKRIHQLQDRDSTDIKTDVRIVYNTVLGKKVLPYEKTHRIGTPRPPEFEMEKIEYVKREGKSFFFLAHIKMINHGKLAMILRDIKYTLTLKDLVKAEGTHPSSIEVKPKTTIREPLKLKAEFSNVWKAMMMILKDKDLVPYKVHIVAVVEGNEDHKPTTIDLVSDGKVELKD